MIELILKNDDEINSTLCIAEEYLVTQSAKETKRITTEYKINVNIKKAIDKNKTITWEIQNVKQKFFNVPKDEIDKFDKILKGVSLSYKVNEDGSLGEMKNLLKTFRKIRVNTKQSVDENLHIGMQPQDKEIIEEIYRDSLEWIYIEELMGLVKKYHKNYGLSMSINQTSKTSSNFNRKIAKEKIPSINCVETRLSSCKTKFFYNLSKKVDYNKTLEIFNKEEELFKPFDKAKLKDLFVSKRFDSGREEELRYDLIVGIIDKFKEKSIIIFGATKTEESLSFEFK